MFEFLLACFLFFGPWVVIFFAIVLPSLRPFVIGAAILAIGGFAGVAMMNDYESKQSFPDTALVVDKDTRISRRADYYYLKLCYAGECQWKEVTQGKYELAKIGQVATVSGSPDSPIG